MSDADDANAGGGESGPAGRGSPGRFITFEGPEGAGKTTVMRVVAQRLRDGGRAVVETREPGGTRAGERVRAVLLDQDSGGLQPIAEALLFGAARAELVAQIIRPALANGCVVLCDRYTDSTLAYQGNGRGLDLDALRAMNAFATGGLEPDRTFLLDVDVQEGLRRRHAEGGAITRLDAESVAFHERVAVGYRALAAAEPERWRVVDASAAVEAVVEAVWAAIEAAAVGVRLKRG